MRREKLFAFSMKFRVCVSYESILSYLRLRGPSWPDIQFSSTRLRKGMELRIFGEGTQSREILFRPFYIQYVFKCGTYGLAKVQKITFFQKSFFAPVSSSFLNMLQSTEKLLRVLEVFHDITALQSRITVGSKPTRLFSWVGTGQGVRGRAGRTGENGGHF